MKRLLLFFVPAVPSRKRGSGTRRRMLLGSLAVFGVTVALTPGAATPAAQKLTVTSSLAGKKVLPHRIQWIARSTGASDVRFLIDGRVRWIENAAPFTYSDDGGYLVTSWLTPGRHRFTVTATSSTGATASETVVARVIATREPPKRLAGSWTRNVPRSVPPDPAFPGDSVPAGRWTIVVDRRWIESRFPGRFDPATLPRGAGNILIDDYTVGQGTITIAGAVTTHPLNDKIAAGGGWWCGPGGPSGSYTWSVSADGTTLTLAPAPSDGCSQRGTIFAGTWRRAGSR